MTSVDPVSSFKEMTEANSGRNFGALDYVHYVLQCLDAGDDVLIALVQILSPEIIEVEGRALVSAVGAVEKYKTYRGQGQSASQAQYWANLILLSDFFKTENEELTRRLCDAVATCWNAKLMQLQWADGQAARTLEDRKEGEIYVGLTDDYVALVVGSPSLERR